MFFSVIIPVYNRPDEIEELLQSLVLQEDRGFEVVIVEDGSEKTCKHLIPVFQQQLDIHYFFIPNVGQGFARNYGMRNSKGDFLVMFDSDCIIPPNYFSSLKSAIVTRNLDAFGGPDAADSGFSVVQKAMNYSMTSKLTTGGIRGKLKNLGKYQARGYNMGLSREAFEKSEGFIDPNKGEDIELSIRLKKLGMKLELVEEAYVIHRRKNTLWGFFKQSYSFGQNRVNVSRYHPEAIKLVHVLPAVFLLFVLALAIAVFVLQSDSIILIGGVFTLAIWKVAVFLDSTLVNKSIIIGLVSVVTSFGQLSAYGLGLIVESLRKLLKG
ncbi:glycosyltransferase [Belliella marina]|uniref:Glycosyltransferase n=1 Tax=Belliella marina TaxID=1644146 RepID=A0ABW4VHA6_9BACT